MLNKIDFNSESLKREFERCSALCPLVRLGDYSDGESATYEVLSSNESDWRIVRFVRSPEGFALGGCSCECGQLGWYCHHLAAALTVHIGLVRHGLRRPVSRSEYNRISDEIWQEDLVENYDGAELSAPTLLLGLFDPGSFFYQTGLYLEIAFYEVRFAVFVCLFHEIFVLDMSAYFFGALGVFWLQFA